jgi:ElaB/YqjD/DUF883 family membrane-anchored ribosome-binding protein
MRDALKAEIANELSDAFINVLRRVGGARGLADGREAVRKSMEAATRYAGDFAEDAADEGRKLVRFANRELRDHPMAAFGAGLAIGALVGMMIAHRNDAAIDS